MREITAFIDGRMKKCIGDIPLSTRMHSLPGDLIMDLSKYLSTFTYTLVSYLFAVLVVRSKEINTM